MIKLGALELGGGRPLVAVSFSDIDGRREVIAARDAGVAIGELRIDLFARHTPDYVALQAERLSVLPTIATIRLASEGGGWTRLGRERIELFEAVFPYVQAIDIELADSETLAILAPRARTLGKRLIVSHHDFEATPSYDTLAAIAARAVEAGADIVKLACQVEGEADIEVLTRVLKEKPAPNLVVIGMGDKGMTTRLAFPALGSLFTFAAQGERASAPGQLSYERTLQILADLPGAGGTS